MLRVFRSVEFNSLSLAYYIGKKTVLYKFTTNENLSFWDLKSYLNSSLLDHDDLLSMDREDWDKKYAYEGTLRLTDEGYM